MKNDHTTSILSRFSDLDSQRHINNASYLSFVRESQLSYLENIGYNLEYLRDNKIFLKPELIHVIFLRQQLSQIQLEVKTCAHRFNNSIHWDHKIYNRDSRELSVHLTMLTPVENNQLHKIDECYDDFPEPLISWNIQENFSDKCKRSIMKYQIRHIDLDGFNQCADSVFWRINEEARWNFMSEINVPFDHLLKNDISLFWINGIYHYYGDVQLNDFLQIYTWISREDKARIYIRQEIVKIDGTRVLRTEGEFLAISLSRIKAIRVPEFLKMAFQNYTEQIQ